MKSNISEYRSKFRSSLSSSVVPLLFTGAFLLIFGFFLFVIYNNSKTEQSKDIHILAERITKNIELKLKGNLDYLKLIALERADGTITEQTFQAHVIHYLTDHPEFINITWVDSNFVIKTVSPLERNSHIIGLHLELPEPKRVSHLARKKRENVYTKPFEAIQANSSFEVWVPVFKNNKFIGLFAGVYSCDQILQLSVPVDKQYTSFISLIDQNEVILAEYPKTNLAKKDISFHVPLLSLANGMYVDVEMLKNQPFSWLIRLLIILISALVISFAYGLWKIKLEIQFRKRIQDSLRKNEIELKRQNVEYLSLNEELTESNNRIQNINQDLRLAKEKAEESDRLKTAFLQNMSHEIRTPMNAIMGFSSLLKDNFNNKRKLEQFSGIINQRGSDLLDIINDILDIAKIESGQLPINLEECNLIDLFEDLTIFFTEFKSRIGKQHINFSLNVNCFQNGASIITDKVKLKQILINLINNAFKFTDNGKIEGGCKFDKNNNLLFYISDTGIGIPKDKQTVVFERFSQLNQTPKKNIGGTGLGLPIVKGLVNLLGGEIFLESEPDKGSMFSFTISYKMVKGLSRQILQVETSDLKKVGERTILIVEDDLYNAEYLKEILANYNLTVLHTETGEDAINIAMSQQIDLILMDIRLPGMPGYEATRQILQHKPLLKIVAQTAYASSDERQKALNTGCIDYISKPTKKETLFSLINKLLENG